jgi:hypothetical protein
MLLRRSPKQKQPRRAALIVVTSSILTVYLFRAGRFGAAAPAGYLFKQGIELSSQPPLPPPVDYSSPRENPRPTSVTVLAGIGIVLGSLGILCKPAGAMLQLLITLPQPNPVMDVFRNDPAIRMFTIGATATGTLLSILLLISSLGSLTLKPWARAGMMAYACLAVVMTFLSQAVGYFLIGPAVESAMRQSGLPQPPGMGWMGPGVNLAIGLVIGLWYPVLIVIYFTRARAKEAFELGLPQRTDI